MRAVIAAAVALLIACSGPSPQESLQAPTFGVVRAYVGTYTTGVSRGIYEIDFDTEAGRFVSEPQLAAESVNPSFLAADRSGRALYAVNESQQFQGAPTGAVSAFAIDPASGRLALLNQQASAGADPCFIMIDPAGRHVLVANYTSGTVAVLPIAAEGRLEPAVSVRQGAGSGPIAARQTGPHAHHIVLDPSSRFVLWTDLGADRVVVDRFDASTGRLEPHKPEGAAIAPGSGPRHLAWHPSGRVLYLLNELSATVTTMSFDIPTGALTAVRTIGAREAGAAGENTAAEIAVSPTGTFLYSSNRGDDNLTVFRIDARTLEPSPVARVSSGGRTPRHFAIDPSGQWLIVANQNSDSLVVLRIDAASGIPSQTTAMATIPSPVNVVFVR